MSDWKLNKDKEVWQLVEQPSMDMPRFINTKTTAKEEDEYAAHLKSRRKINVREDLKAEIKTHPFSNKNDIYRDVVDFHIMSICKCNDEESKTCENFVGCGINECMSDDEIAIPAIKFFPPLQSNNYWNDDKVFEFLNFITSDKHQYTRKAFDNILNQFKNK